MSGISAVCPHCRKPVKGKRVITNPPMFEIALGTAKVEHYHPNCYLKVGSPAGAISPT